MTTNRTPPTAATYSLTAPIEALLAEAGSTITALARGETVDPRDAGRWLLDIEEAVTAAEQVAAGLAADPHLCDPGGWAVTAAIWAGVEGELSAAEWDTLRARWQRET